MLSPVSVFCCLKTMEDPGVSGTSNCTLTVLRNRKRRHTHVSDFPAWVPGGEGEAGVAMQQVDHHTRCRHSSPVPAALPVQLPADVPGSAAGGPCHPCGRAGLGLAQSCCCRCLEGGSVGGESVSHCLFHPLPLSGHSAFQIDKKKKRPVFLVWDVRQRG